MSFGLVLVAAASFVASAVNAIAGGGTFITFPSLTGFMGMSDKLANMTSTVGLWPGSASSVVAAKDDLRTVPRGMLWLYTVISLIGGTAGAILLRVTPEHSFKLVIPWLLAFATVIFAFSKPIARWAGRQHGDRSLKWTLFVGALQLVVAVYGGYFGAGIGVLMIAGLSFAGLDHLNQMNALKVLLATVINGVASIIFLFGRINWTVAIVMAAASIVGGVLGMAWARRVPQPVLRGMILAIGITLTAVYFWKNYR
jgi:uncharacterized membrane protein YfcA